MSMLFAVLVSFTVGVALGALGVVMIVRDNIITHDED